MRALHVFPLFGSDLISGSEYYEFMLSRSLARLGVEVEVLATRSRVARPVSAFTLSWPDEFPDGGPRLEDGMRVSRFSSSLTIPARVGHGLSRWMFNRWEREEAAYGKMLEGSRYLPDHLFRCARERPRRYGWLTSLGRGPVSLPLLRALSRRLPDADVVLVGFFPFSLVPQVVTLARWHQKPVVVLALFHPNDRYHYFHELFGALRRADCTLLQTSFSRDLLARALPGARTLVIGAGVDAGEFESRALSGTRFRRLHGLGSAPLVLYVGRKEPGKRYEVAVEAVERSTLENTRLVMIGRDSDGKPIPSGRALYLGERPRDEVLDAYDACDAFILPSDHESFGIVLLEAWMRGKPVLANRACLPVASLVEEGVDGFLCREPEEYAGAIDRLLADPALRERMGRRGREKVLARYTWERIGATVRDLYAELAEGGRVG